MANTPAVFGRGPFDSKITEGFASGLSAEEVSDSINNVLSPEQCLSRVTKLIRSRDVLDNKDRLALLLEDAYWLRAKLKKQMEEAGYIGKDTAKTWLDTLEHIVTRIEKAQLGMGDALLRFNEVRAQEFFHALTLIGGALADALSERHGIDSTEVDEIILEAIPEAIPEIQ